MEKRQSNNKHELDSVIKKYDQFVKNHEATGEIQQLESEIQKDEKKNMEVQIDIEEQEKALQEI